MTDWLFAERNDQPRSVDQPLMEEHSPTDAELYRIARILDLQMGMLMRIANALESYIETQNRHANIDAWAHGHGKHPDD